MLDEDVVLLMVPGWGNSGDRHWQTLWELTYPLARRVEQQNWLYPDKDSWVTALADAVAGVDGKLVIAAHSLGCHATVAWLRSADFVTQRRIKGVLLVAPPALPITTEQVLASGELPAGAPLPDFAGFTEVDGWHLPVPTVMLASRNDRFCAFDDARQMAEGWGVKLVDAGECGHMGSHDGLGSWPLGQQWVQHFMLG